MATIKITPVGKTHVLVSSGSGAEHVCALDDPEGIGKAVLEVLENAGNEPPKSERRTEEQKVNGRPRAEQHVSPEQEMSVGQALFSIFSSPEARDILDAALEVGERFSVKDSKQEPE